MKEEPGSKKKKQKSAKAANIRWIIRISLITVAISIVLTFLSQEAMDGAGTIVALLVLLCFIAIGIIFDIIGIAIATADEKPFHSMAAHKEKGAGQALRLIRNADRASSFCNDVVGDISGIVSGTTSAVIVTRLTQSFNWDSVLVTLVVSGIVAGMTVGGKAVGKNFAMQHSTQIVHFVGRLLWLFPHRKSK